MTDTIWYDRGMKNLIDPLLATGHVTRKSSTKKYITFHHNGGRLSHEGVLQVWKTRPASAHFDVDGAGAACQYVPWNWYAWATGSTQGNLDSISIEMANSTTAPGWNVAEATWKSAARLGAWLCAAYLKVSPRQAFRKHHDWSSTLCPGPFIDSIWNEMLEIAESAYNFWTGKSVPTKAPAPAPTTIKSPFAWYQRQLAPGPDKDKVYGVYPNGTKKWLGPAEYKSYGSPAIKNYWGPYSQIVQRGIHVYGAYADGRLFWLSPTDYAKLGRPKPVKIG